MEISPGERKIRRRLRLLRFLNGYLPISLMRYLIKKGNNRINDPSNVRRKSIIADGVNCDWFIPDGADDDHVLLYFHGGGFILGVSPLHYILLFHLSRKMKVRILSVNYRLAPEYPFPAALEDCTTAYRWLVKQGISPHNIMIAGDSAGANLTITTLMNLRDNNDELPASAACLSPVADFTERDDMIKNKYDLLLHPRAVKLYNKSYIADNNKRNPLISPIFGNWADLPPIIIHAGEDEILSDDAKQIERLADNNIDVEVKIFPRMWHVWQLYPNLPETEQSLSEIIEFLSSHLD